MHAVCIDSAMIVLSAYFKMKSSSLINKNFYSQCKNKQHNNDEKKSEKKNSQLLMNFMKNFL